MSAIDFYLSSLDQTITMDVSGMFEGVAPSPFPDVSATAVYYVAKSAMMDAFTFVTDSLDVNDVSASDITYATAWPANYVVNPSHAYVIDGAVTTEVDDNRLLVKHDFIRHIADSLFNTHKAVDLFSNEDEMRNNLATKGDEAATTSTTGIHAKLEEQATAELIFKNMVNADPSRFSSLTEDDAANNKYKFPFIVGDTIGFKATYQPASDQSNIFTGAPTVNERPYLIKLIVVETLSVDSAHAQGTNVTPDDVDEDGTAVATNTSYVNLAA